MGPSSGHWRDGGIDEAFTAEAGVALTAIRVEDPERRPATRRAGPAASYEDLGLLTDDVTTEAEPRSTRQLEADSRRLADGRHHRRDEPRRLEDDEADPRPSGEGREPAEAVGDASGVLEAWREIDDEEVDGPAGEQRARHREALLGIGRGQDDEPFQPDAAGDGLDRVEGRGEIEPGDDRAGRLSFRDEPQGERRPPAREVASKRQAEPARQAARSEDRVEVGEAGREDPRRISLRGCFGVFERDRRERADDLADPRGSGRAPLRPEGRQGCRHVGGERRHPRIIEQMFE
jgi:hypothetical protein